MLLSRLNRLSVMTKLSLFISLFVLVGVFVAVSLSLSRQDLRSSAAFENQRAETVCGEDGAIIRVSFRNSEPRNSQAVNVEARDVQTGLSAEMGVVGVGQRKTVEIETKREYLDSSSVILYVSKPGEKEENSEELGGVSYAGIGCYVPTPSGGGVNDLILTIEPTKAKSKNDGRDGLGDKLAVNLPTVVPGGVLFNLDILLHGIGSAGDKSNSKSSGNQQPVNEKVGVTLDIFDEDNNLVMSRGGDVVYASDSGSFIGSIDMGTDLKDGLYLVKVKANNYLRASVPGIASVSAGEKIDLPKITLVAGDFNNDNAINILDLNVLMGCYSDLNPAKDCEDLAGADLTGDGKVDQFDYNLFLRELTSREGE